VVTEAIDVKGSDRLNDGTPLWSPIYEDLRHVDHPLLIPPKGFDWSQLDIFGAFLQIERGLRSIKAPLSRTCIVDYLLFIAKSSK
jgi:hypothetical protein